MNRDGDRPLVIEPGLRVWVGGHNVEVRREVEGRIEGSLRPPVGVVDVAVIAPLSVGEAVHFAGKLLSRIARGGPIWVVFDPDASEAKGRPAARPLQRSRAIVPRGLNEGMQSVGIAPVDFRTVGDKYLAIRYGSSVGGAFGDHTRSA